MAITAGDVRCLFDVLGGDLVVKGTQQELVNLLLTVSYCKHGSHKSGMTRKIPTLNNRNSCHIMPSFLWFGNKLCTWSGRICRSGVLNKCLLRITADLIRSRILQITPTMLSMLLHMDTQGSWESKGEV